MSPSLIALATPLIEIIKIVTNDYLQVPSLLIMREPIQASTNFICFSQKIDK